MSEPEAPTAKRVVLIGPDDVLLIKGVSTITPADMEPIGDAFRKLGIPAIVFADDIEIDQIPAAELKRPSHTEPRRDAK